MPEGGYDRLLCNLSTTWLLWQVPLQVGECQWGRSAIHPSTNICRYLWPVLSQVPLHYNTFPCFVTFPHLRTLVCISVPAPQKVAIFLICSAVDGRGRQQRTNTAPQKHLFDKFLELWWLGWQEGFYVVHTCCLCSKYISKSSARAWSCSGITFVPSPTVWGLPLYSDKWWHHNGAKWKAAAEKIIIVARPTINCQQVQDLSTELNLCWCTPAPRLLKYKYKGPKKKTVKQVVLGTSWCMAVL